MAPTAPTPGKRLTARQKAQARLKDPLLPRKLHRANNVVSDTFIDSKRDRRTIKHSAFISRIQKKAADSGATASQRRRRRPNKKLVAGLESLAAELEDIATGIHEQDEKDAAEGMDAEQKKMGRVRHRSLKTRPGALKRKEMVVREEMGRFKESLALLAGVKEGGASAGEAGDEGMKDLGETKGKKKNKKTAQTAEPVQGTSSRFAALRGFISSTMEQNPAFLNKS